MDVIVHWLANLNGYFPSFGQLLLHPTHTPPICQTQTLYVFFGFYFCNNPRSSLPLISYFWSTSLGLKPTTFMHPAKTNFHLVVPHTNQTREGWVELCLPSHSIHFDVLEQTSSYMSSLGPGSSARWSLRLRWCRWAPCFAQAPTCTSCGGWCRWIWSIINTKFPSNITIHMITKLGGGAMCALTQMIPP